MNTSVRLFERLTHYMYMRTAEFIATNRVCLLLEQKASSLISTNKTIKVEYE